MFHFLLERSVDFLAVFSCVQMKILNFSTVKFPTNVHRRKIEQVYNSGHVTGFHVKNVVVIEDGRCKIQDGLEFVVTLLRCALLASEECSHTSDRYS